VTCAAATSNPATYAPFGGVGCVHIGELKGRTTVMSPKSSFRIRPGFIPLAAPFGGFRFWLPLLVAAAFGCPFGWLPPLAPALHQKQI